MNELKRVLAATVRPRLLAKLEALQTSVDVKFESVGNSLAFQALTWRRRFDLLIAELPFPGLEPANFLRTLRSKQCASVASPVVFLDREGYESTPHSIDPILSELVTTCTSLTQTLKVVTDTLKLSDRSAVHLFAETEMIVDSVRIQRVCQTENVSPTGMLLRTNLRLPLGSVVPFSLRLPEDVDPIHGRGEVVRYADAATESVSGMAVRFFGLDGDGDARLGRFLQAP